MNAPARHFHIDVIRHYAGLASARRQELVVYDPWTINLNLRAMTQYNKKAKKLEQPRLRNPTPRLLGRASIPRLHWLPRAIGYENRVVITRPPLRPLISRSSRWTELNDGTNILLDGDVTLAVLGPGNIVATLRKRDGEHLPAAVSVQLTSKKTIAKNKQLRANTTRGRLVAFLGTRDGIAIALDHLHTILSNPERLALQIRDSEQMSLHLKGLDLAGAKHSRERSLYAKATDIPGLRLVRSYAAPILPGAIRLPKLTAG